MDVFLILIIVALILTIIAMTIGVSAMSGGGEVDNEFSNLLMWVRVGLQALTVALLILALYLR